MAPKKKGQPTLNHFFGLPNTLKAKETSYDVIDFDLNEDPNIDDDDEVQEEESSSQRKQKAQPKRVFREQWKTKYPRLHCNYCDGNPLMKCEWCELCNAPGPWGNGDGCNTIQHDAVVTHANSHVHKASKTSWLYKMERLAKPIPKHITNIDDANKERVITTMKLAYFIA
eukprot:Gb_38491 [translate_table: standard]